MLRNGWEKRQGEVARALPEQDVVFEASIALRRTIWKDRTKRRSPEGHCSGPTHLSHWSVMDGHLVSDDFVASPFRRQRAVEPSPSIHELTC